MATKGSIAEILDQLNLLDEGVRIEAKRGLGKEALHTISAFANEPGQGGGTLVFGVMAKGENNTGRDGYDVVGVFDPMRGAGPSAQWILTGTATIRTSASVESTGQETHVFENREDGEKTGVREPKRQGFPSEMVRRIDALGELERTYPENPAHPRQAYRTTVLGKEKP
jgi:hypothetical protein